MMAYFIGCKFGKKKICPEISPKKTVEGSIAGIIGVIVSYIVLALIMNNFYDYSINIFLVAFMGLVTSIAG